MTRPEGSSANVSSTPVYIILTRWERDFLRWRLYWLLRIPSGGAAVHNGSFCVSVVREPRPWVRTGSPTWCYICQRATTVQLFEPLLEPSIDYRPIIAANPAHNQRPPAKAGGMKAGGLNRRLKEKTAESRWFGPRAAPFGWAKAASWKINHSLKGSITLSDQFKFVTLRCKLVLSSMII